MGIYNNEASTISEWHGNSLEIPFNIDDLLSDFFLMLIIAQLSRVM
jgi:hypothetical protein